MLYNLMFTMIVHVRAITASQPTHMYIHTPCMLTCIHPHPVNVYIYTGGGDIVDGNLKLILGLIWTLILHYQISKGFGTVTDEHGKNGGTSPKQALLEWLQVHYTCMCTYNKVYMFTHFKLSVRLKNIIFHVTHYC